MTGTQNNNPLHGLTLEAILTHLVDHYGWDELARLIDINCFKSDPSIKSSLKFLRTTPWARTKVEDLYVQTVSKSPRQTDLCPEHFRIRSNQSTLHDPL